MSDFNTLSRAVIALNNSMINSTALYKESYESKRDKAFESNIPKKYHKLILSDITPELADEILEYFGSYIPNLVKKSGADENKMDEIKCKYAYSLLKENIEKEKKDYDKQYEEENPRLSTKLKTALTLKKAPVPVHESVDEYILKLYEACESGEISIEDRNYYLNLVTEDSNDNKEINDEKKEGSKKVKQNNSEVSSDMKKDTYNQMMRLFGKEKADEWLNKKNGTDNNETEDNNEEE